MISANERDRVTSLPILDAELQAIRALFRSEIEDDPEHGFDRSAQLRVISGTLTHLRASHQHFWKRIHETRGIWGLHDSEHRGIREFKKLLENLVRTADESIDHHRTVSFVSRSVLESICQKGYRRPATTQLLSKDFGHEHGVPVDAIIRMIVHPRNCAADLYSVLSAMSCRALLLREQVTEIDAEFKASIPGWVDMPWGSYPAGALPLRYLALSRYHAASPSLLDELVPISRRAAALLTEFRSFINEPGGEISWVKKMALDHKTTPIAYIPEYAFDWGRRKMADHAF